MTTKDQATRMQELQMAARSYQAEVGLVLKDISPEQVQALVIRCKEVAPQTSRADRLATLSKILGYDQPVASSKDLSMADAMGLLDLPLDEFRELFIYTYMHLAEDGIGI